MDQHLIIRPEAEVDLTDVAGWYDSREPGLGLEFLLEVHSAIARALKNPESFTMFAEIYRPIVFIRRFPYRVFFIDRQDALVVFAVLHAARHDRVWNNRVGNE